MDIVKHGTYNISDGNGAGWWFGYDREATTYYRRRVRFSSYYRSFWQDGYFTENTLHHYYLESSASGWKVYTDGYLNNSGTNGFHQNTTLLYAPVLFNCGVSSVISDVLLFRRALSPAEIAVLSDRTDPMLGGLIREKRSAPIYSLPSVNHWELQIRVNSGDWDGVPNLESSVREYLISSGLVSGSTYQARIRKFTNGVPSVWEVSNIVTYVPEGSGTPYEITYQFIFESGLVLSSTFSSESLSSSEVDESYDSAASISSTYESDASMLYSVATTNENDFDAINSVSSHGESNVDTTDIVASQIIDYSDIVSNTSSTNEIYCDNSSDISLYTESDFSIGSSVSSVFLIYHDNCADISIAGTYTILQDFEIALSELKHVMHLSAVESSSSKEVSLDSMTSTSSSLESSVDSESKISEFNQTQHNGLASLSTNIITNHPLSISLSSISLSDVSSGINISEPYMISVVSEADVRYVEFIINDLQIIKLKTAKKQSAFLNIMKSTGSLVINKLSKR